MKEISAGGVVYRRVKGQLQIQLIEDRFGKVSLPKGKMESGETLAQTALREIEEETGITGAIVEPLMMIHYQYQHPVQGLIDKEVTYYLVEANAGSIKPQIEEIRNVSWFEPLKAWDKQYSSGYDNNTPVVKLALEKLGIEVNSDDPS